MGYVLYLNTPNYGKYLQQISTNYGKYTSRTTITLLQDITTETPIRSILGAVVYRIKYIIQTSIWKTAQCTNYYEMRSFNMFSLIVNLRIMCTICFPLCFSLLRICTF